MVTAITDVCVHVDTTGVQYMDYVVFGRIASVNNECNMEQLPAFLEFKVSEGGVHTRAPCRQVVTPPGVVRWRLCSKRGCSRSMRREA